MTAGLDQVAGQQANCLAAQSPTLPLSTEEEVDPRAPVLRIGDLLVLDQPGQAACDLDRVFNVAT